ncbi:MAG: rhodanese-like domain-containing protein [Agathobaculum sp.]|nr:rhodanese-like domain-containing protein [Agathobaculum sp.]MDY3617747.1 rhodanese-like domain-containing protein [Agathobaculum sp.]
MNSWKAAAAMAAMLAVLSGCGAAPTQAKPQTDGMQQSGTEEKQDTMNKAYHKITAEEAKKMMDEGGVTIVDVRTEEEYREGHVQDAILVPNETISTEPPEALPDKDAKLLVYCRSGRRSKDASDKLVDMGYQNVFDFGGIIDWPYDTVTE